MAGNFSAFADPSLVNRVVIITGGGRGLGREMALALLESGCRVTITSAKSVSELSEVEARAAEAGAADRLMALQADITIWDDCQRVVDETRSKFGRVDVLVNNAGRGLLLLSPTFTTNPVKFWEADIDSWRQIIDTNINGTFLMSKAAVPPMVEQGFGRVINISTSLQTMVRKGYSPYGPSKAALEAASLVWARDLEGTGVTVNVLLPGGATDTAFLPAGPNRRGADGNLFDPDIMRAPIVWLASDASNESTGHRYIAKDFDPALPIHEAVEKSRQESHELPIIM